MANLAVKTKNIIINTINKSAEHTTHRVQCVSTVLSATKTLFDQESTVKTNNFAIKHWNKFKAFISKKIKGLLSSKTYTKEDCKAVKIPNDDVNNVLERTIGKKPYRIAASGYSFDTAGYEEPTRAFLQSIENALGGKNTAYVLPPTLDKGSIYDITAQISGISKDKTLFVTTESFYDKYLNLANFSQYINMKKYIKTPVYIFPTTEIYTRATANASNVLVCTGGRDIAINEIIEAIKRKNKVVLLLNLNMKNGTYNNINEVENAARYFDELRLTQSLKCSEMQKLELKELLEQPNLINKFVRVYLANDAKSAAKSGKRAADFIKSEGNSDISSHILPSIDQVKTMPVSILRELATSSDGIALIKKAGSAVSKQKAVQTMYGQIKYKIVKTPDGQIILSKLIVPNAADGKSIDILKDIPQKILQSPVYEHIHKINWSTINPNVGVVVTQNQSKPVIARKIITEGTLENSLVKNNSQNIPLRYDIVNGNQYIETTSKRQALTGNGLMVVYSEPVRKKTASVLKTMTEDRSFMPVDIADKQYEIITKSGKRVPCIYANMVSGVDYKISKKAGVELKMAVPPREVISSEGEILAPNKLYMVDSNGHFYDGNPIKRIKNREINWNADMSDPVQAQIRKYIDKALQLECESKKARKTGNKDLSKNLMQRAEQFTSKAESMMTDWVKSVQNKNNTNFFL